MSLREAAEQALKVLTDYVEDPRCQKEIDQVAEALRQALAQPVDAVNMSQERVDKTAKGKHKWVGLTDADIAKAMQGSVEGSNMLPYQFARAIEAKLKEKNA